MLYGDLGAMLSGGWRKIFRRSRGELVRYGRDVLSGFVSPSVGFLADWVGCEEEVECGCGTDRGGRMREDTISSQDSRVVSFGTKQPEGERHVHNGSSGD